MPDIPPYIEIATVIPVNIVDKNRKLANNFHWKHFDAWLHNEQYTDMASAPCHPQKWQNDDIIFLQLQSNISPITINVRNIKTHQVVLSHIADQVAVINGVIYSEDQVALDNLAIFKEGYYQMEIYGGDNFEIKTVTEILHIKPEHYGTMLAKYSNNFNDTVLWETGIEPMLRFDGLLPWIATKSVRTTYIDQLYNARTVKNRSFRLFNLNIGTVNGEPSYIFDKLAEINGLNNLSYDDVAFAPTVNAEIDMQEIGRYGLHVGVLEVTDASNKRAKRFGITDDGGGGQLVKKWTATYNTEGSLFGPIDGDANDNSYLIDRTF